MPKKLKEKIRKSILVCFICFAISSVSSAYDEFTEKKYKTFDDKIFEIKENAILHEKVQKKVGLLLEAFKKEIEEFKQQKYNKYKQLLVNGIYISSAYEYDYLNELREREGMYEEYNNCLYGCFKKLEEKGIEVEIKLMQSHGTCTTYRSSSLK